MNNEDLSNLVTSQGMIIVQLESKIQEILAMFNRLANAHYDLLFALNKIEENKS